MKEVVYLDKPNITVFEDVIPPEVCDEIVAKHIADTMNPDSGGQSRQESYAQVTERVENRGISKGMDPYHYDILASAIVKYSKIPFSHIEAIDIYNYEPGCYLDMHHDYPYDPRQINYYRNGGDRVGTGIFFLTDDFEGGITSFPMLGVDIQPKKGSYLYFRQSYDEATNWSTIHESSQITNGVKWIASCFFSDRPRVGYSPRDFDMQNDNPEFTEPFYIKKFMDIQQTNIILWRKLKQLNDNPELDRLIKEQYGDDFFDGIEEYIR